MGNILKGIKLVNFHQEVDTIIAKCKILLSNHPDVENIIHDLEGQLFIEFRNVILTGNFNNVIADMRTFAQDELKKYISTSN
jgi:hypothetical protein